MRVLATTMSPESTANAAGVAHHAASTNDHATKGLAMRSW